MLLEDINEGFTSDKASSKLTPVPVDVNDSVLTKVLEWCVHHKDDPPYTSCADEDPAQIREIDEWDREFIQVDQQMLYEIIRVISLPPFPFGALSKSF